MSESTGKTEEQIQKEKKQKQARIKQEIIDTEKTYNDRLHILQDDFLTPLKSDEKFKHDQEVQNFVKEISDALNPLITLSDNLLKALTEANADIITVLSSATLKNFSNYFCFYDQFFSKMQTLKTQNINFNEFLKRKENNPKLEGKNFEDYLIEPIQRLPRYPILLEELLKYTSNTDLFYEQIKSAKQKVETTIKLINSLVGANGPQLEKLKDKIESYIPERQSKLNAVRTFFKGVDRDEKAKLGEFVNNVMNSYLLHLEKVKYPKLFWSKGENNPLLSIVGQRYTLNLKPNDMKDFLVWALKKDHEINAKSIYGAKQGKLSDYLLETLEAIEPGFSKSKDNPWLPSVVDEKKSKPTSRLE